ncbi:hypothetical protein OROGR_013465 [Orobanche gracilis]
MLNHGIDEEVVIKFRESDIETCLCLVTLNNKDITAITGVADEAELKKINAVALKLVNESGALGDMLGDVIPKDKGTGGEVLNDEEHFVVVKNLPGDTSMEQVREHFKVAGYPTRIVL